MAKPYVVGLTGGIACGKSSIAAVLHQLGVPVIEADTLSRTLTLPGTPAHRAIVEHFGPDCVNTDGTLNRPYLRECIFFNKKKRQWLEKLLHPLIFESCLNALAALPPDTLYAVLDIPLLIESKLVYPIDSIWVVDTEPELQKTRLKSRDDLTPELIQAILAAQAPRATRLKKADVIIDNNKTLKDLQQILIILHKNLLRKLTK